MAKFKSEDKIRCINIAGVALFLTYNKKYTVLKVGKRGLTKCILIKDDMNNRHVFSENRFIKDEVQ